MSSSSLSLLCCRGQAYQALAEEEGETKTLSVKDFLRVYKSLLPFFWPPSDLPGSTGLKVRLVVSLSLVLVSKLVNLAVPITMARAVDALGIASPSIPFAWILAYAGLMVASSVVSELQQTVFLNVTQHASRMISVRSFKHLHDLPLQYHLHRKTGAVLTTINRGTSSISQLIRITLFTLMPAFLEFFMTTVLLIFSYGWSFGLNMFLCITAYVLLTGSLTAWRKRFRRVQNVYENKKSDVGVDSLLNFETVKAFSGEAYEVDRYDKAIIEFQKVEIASRISLLFLNSGQKAIIALGLLGGLILAAWKITTNSLSVGDMFAVQIFMIQVTSPLSWLGSSWEFSNQSAMDAESLQKIFDEPITIEDAPAAVSLDVSQSTEVEFDNVYFSYPKSERRILNGISFKIPTGHTVGIVGPTGSGKSTLARLLLRYYDPDEGRVRVAGKDLARDVTTKSLRQHIGVVAQDTVLFNDTLGFNIGYGSVASGIGSEAEIRRAAEEAQLTTFLQRAPDGLDTLVGERGLRLSGGEKQRVAIARVLLKNPEILILDEATSALDSTTEKLITESLEALARNRTTLVIAHRLSTVQSADQILVLDNGKIVERGSHSELIKMGGLYHQLWMTQARQDAEKEEETIF